MDSLRRRIEEETRIGKLKQLVIELNENLPNNKRVKGYSKITAKDIENLRQLALDTIDLRSYERSVTPRAHSPLLEEKKEESNEDPQAVSGETTMADLKAMAKMLGIKGVQKWTRDKKDELVKKINEESKPRELEKRSKRKISAQISPQISKAVREREKKRRLSPRRKDLSLGSGRCNSSNSIKTLKYTNSLEEFDKLKFRRINSGNIDVILKTIGTKRSKLVTEELGTYASIYIDKYNDQLAVFKVVKFIDAMGFIPFKWECVAAERAAKIGVAPEIFEKYVCYDNKNYPKYGVIIMKRCGMIDEDYTPTDEELRRMHGMIMALADNGIVHKDIATRNIMRNGDNFAFIDYGLALVYDGKIPKEMRIWDHFYLSSDIRAYYRFLRKHYSKAFMEYLDTLESPKVLESITARNFPSNMIETLAFDDAIKYLNHLTSEVPSKISSKVQKVLYDRYEEILGKDWGI